MLLTGASLAAVPGHVRPSSASEPSGTAVTDRLQRLGTPATRTQTTPPAATPEPFVDLSEPAPPETAMILPPVNPNDAAKMAAASPAAGAAPTPTVTPAAEDGRISPVSEVARASQDPRADGGVAGGYQTAGPELHRPVDIEQIADSEARALWVAQLGEPQNAADGALTFAQRVDAMQIALPPPPRLRDAERAALLAESPSHLLVRIGDTSLGSVALRTSEGNGFDVQLSGLLDLLADRFDSSEFERLRASAAADTFVNFAQLRAIGLKLRYDPVYDEQRITG
jgi:hypothetical protein